MRIIDADALCEVIEDHVTTVSVCPSVDWAMGKTQFKKMCLEDIKRTPTIPAIPVEWLESQIRPYTGDVSDIGKSSRNGTIKNLIREWQKEQEAQDG